MKKAAPAPKPAKKQKKRAKGTVLEEHDYLQQEEIDALLAVIDSKRDRAIFTLVYHFGLRAHEVGKLRLEDFRARDGYLFIHRGKGSVSRHYALTKKALKELRAWLKVRGDAPGPIFRSRQGRGGIGRRRLDQLMKEYCRAAGVDPGKAHMHALKHSCGTHLRERGESGEVIQDWLGHKSRASTEIYLHFSPKQRQDAVERNRDW